MERRGNGGVHSTLYFPARSKSTPYHPALRDMSSQHCPAWGRAGMEFSFRARRWLAAPPRLQWAAPLSSVCWFVGRGGGWRCL
eukprot:355521-Chlamydomonas_euryale.AAC.4